MSKISKTLKLCTIGGMLCVVILPTDSHSLTTGKICPALGCQDNGAGLIPTIRVSNCTSYTTECYGTNTSNVIQSCNICKSGYTRTAKTTTLGQPCINTATYYDCVKPCDGTCDDCTNSVNNIAPGYDQTITATCNTSTCECKKQAGLVVCATGYYGMARINISGGYTGCTKCPSPGTSARASTLITHCYIPANGITVEDSTGYWVCTAAMYADSDGQYY